MNDNKLNNTILNRIENTCKELQEIITKRLVEEIPELELFKVIGDKNIYLEEENEKKSNSNKKGVNAENNINRLSGGFNRHFDNDHSSFLNLAIKIKKYVSFYKEQEQENSNRKYH